MKKAIVLLSGGLDSTTVLSLAQKAGFTTYALSFDYGQRHDIELESAKKIAALYQVKEHKIAKIDLRIFGGSALTDEIAVPKNTSNPVILNSNSTPIILNSPPVILSAAKDLVSQTPNTTHEILRDAQDDRSDDKNKIPVTYVPARNTIFLSYALAYAETIQAFDIFIGVNAVDFSNYPDCRPDFIATFEKLASLATAAGVEGKGSFKIHAPLMNWSKKEIIENGINIGVDYSQTHSCYDPVIKNNQVLSCGKCDSCQLRLAGFAAANQKDPISYV